jgi:hypothetical protein
MSIESPARAAGRASSRARLAAAVVGLIAAATSSSVEAHEPSPRAPAAPVTLGEVSSDAAAAGASRLANVTDLLRLDAEAELSAIDWSKAAIHRRYTVSAVLVRLTSARVGDRALQISCTVSAAVRDTERGTLLAIVEGRARAEDLPAAAADTERDALAGAVRGAITALPKAILSAQ